MILMEKMLRLFHRGGSNEMLCVKNSALDWQRMSENNKIKSIASKSL